MINLTVDEIIILHERLIEKTGGLTGIRDRGMLESAVYSIMQSFDGVIKHHVKEQQDLHLQSQKIMLF